MSDGYKAVQSAHAAINFTFEHPGRAGPWFKESNYLVLLELSNEKQLKLLINKCEHHQLAYTVFREPDINNQITAIAIEPSPITRKLVQKIPLLFKSKQNGTTKNYGHESQVSQYNKDSTLQKEAG